MLDEIGDINSRETNYPGRLRTVAVLFVSIAVLVAPLLIARRLYNEYGISKIALLTELVVPAVYLSLMLLTIILMARTRTAGSVDIVWFRWTCSEVIKAFLLTIAVLLLWALLNLLMHKLGLRPSWGVSFWADQRGLVFFVVLTILTVVLFPIVEEVLWRGYIYIQSTLRRIIGSFPAWLGQAVLFALIHFRPLGGFIPIFFLGLATGIWRWRRRTLVPIILAHMAVNSLWYTVHWPVWLDCTRIKITTDYLAQYKTIIGYEKLDPNDNARDFYEKASQSVTEVPKELYQVSDIWPTNWSSERATISTWLSANKQALNYVAEGAKKTYRRQTANNQSATRFLNASSCY